MSTHCGRQFYLVSYEALLRWLADSWEELRIMTRKLCMPLEEVVIYRFLTRETKVHLTRPILSISPFSRHPDRFLTPNPVSYS